MPQPRAYSIEEVLNLTVEDIQAPDFVDVKVKGWQELASEQRERCVSKLRDLVNQRDKIAQSTAVDASALEDRLNRLSRSRSPTPVLPPYDPEGPEFFEEHTRREREAYEALIHDNGRPCYPIELGFEVFNHPGPYDDLFAFWRESSGSAGNDKSRLIFTFQLDRWKRFRQCQQRSRRYFTFHNRFPEFQQNVLERRRRYGLDGDIRLLEKQDKQTKLDDWMEYQDFELQTYDHFKKELKATQERLASRRKILAETGHPAFNGIQELEFGEYYGLAIEYDGKVAKAESKERLAERNLRLAEKRLKAAKSDDLGERVERATWVALFLKEVEYAQRQVDELQRLSDDVEREVEPYLEWWEARKIEWEERTLKNMEGGKQMNELERESTEYKEKFQKRRELRKKSWNAKVTCSCARREVEFTEEGYKAAQLDNIGQSIERAALIKLVQDEVRSAHTQLKQAREPMEKIILQRKVISALSSISVTKEKMRQQNILLAWIEQQRREMTGSQADSKKAEGQGRRKKASSRSRQDRPPTETSRLNRSRLSPVNPRKVSKASNKRRSPHRKTSFSYAVLQKLEKMIADSGVPESRNKRASKVKDVIPAPLRPIHPSRVSKTVGKQPTRLHRDNPKAPPIGKRRPIHEHILDTLSDPSIGRIAMQKAGHASPRRSPRTSKPPERFRPGNT